MNIDTRLKNYWRALRGLRTARDRSKWLKGPFSLAISLEKDPRLRARLINIYNTEDKQPA
ncbi:MAG: hypothetical protein K5863_08725 [Nitratireductor sp.]|uniref:hypothetical protein n=1 Tax=Nitratireductor TaxID=245876 RepID=UPI002635BDBA|nr:MULTISPECIES: hypothetical protein [Nitratireductor]MCV0350146.1 hypothetical protein [Nitratireductor sp.]MDV2965537.1 hypothetical protein [Nitratireductor aquimarinus]